MEEKLTEAQKFIIEKEKERKRNSLIFFILITIVVLIGYFFIPDFCVMWVMIEIIGIIFSSLVNRKK